MQELYLNSICELKKIEKETGRCFVNKFKGIYE